MRDISMRVLTAVILGGIVLASIIINNYTLAIIISLASVIAIWELAIALKEIKMIVPLIPACLAGGAMPILTCYGGLSLLMVSYVIFCAGIFLYSSFEAKVKDRHTGFMTGIFAITYIPLFLSFYVVLRSEPSGMWKILLVILGTVASDTGGLIIGAKFGRNQMSRIISPNKTWEGLIGSFVFCLIVQSIFIFIVFPDIYFSGYFYIPILISLITTVLGTFGDLVESVIKREADIKDIGGILPGHGGVLDRLDSLVILAPIAYFTIGLLTI